MLLQAKDLLDERKAQLLAKRAELKTRPGLALIWVGSDHQTELFINAKQKMAKDLDCDFYLHHFVSIAPRQLRAVIDGLNRKKEIHGIVLQLPLPKSLLVQDYIDALALEKDVDGLKDGSPFGAPTAEGIVALLKHNYIGFEPRKTSDPSAGTQAKTLPKTVIIGAGKLVGQPLAEIFRRNGWPFDQITSNAQAQAATIASYDVVIACTGQQRLITPAMVTPNTVLIDGSGVDVDVKTLEPLVKLITPAKGAVGPLTVSFLFENLLTAASS